MNTLKNLLLLISSFFISLIIWLSTYNSLPERVIMHVDSTGPTEYAHKGFMFIMFMIISFCILVILFGLLLIDRKNENKQKMNKAFAIVGSLFVVGLNVIYILNVHNESLNTESLFLIFVGCIFIVIGNYLPTIKYNSKVGIRNVASFKNKKTWNKIQRFSGNIFVICGTLIAFAALIPSFLYAILTILLIIAAMLYIIQVYSNRVFEND